MSNIQLSKDADYLICLIYKHYLELRDNGISKSDAKSIGDSHDVHSNIIPKWTFSDVEDTCLELINNELLTSHAFVDDECGDMQLSDIGIVYMERRFPDKLDKLIDYISKLIP